jgi:putative hydrolase of the HAD superfamily
LQEGCVTIRAVLFDVGGPLDTEVEHERAIDADIRAAFVAAGCAVTDEQYDAASRYAVECFAWDAYSAIIWRLAGADPDLARRVSDDFRSRARGRNVFELRPGMDGLLRRLHARGLRLGLAANQPAVALDRLDAAGVGGYFHYRHVSETLGFRKPDPRLFLHACESLEVEPEECIMVGDRVDNDIAPARMLGMRTVLLRTGRHLHQQPRTWLEVPDAEVWDVPGVEAAIVAMLQ